MKIGNVFILRSISNLNAPSSWFIHFELLVQNDVQFLGYVYLISVIHMLVDNNLNITSDSGLKYPININHT